MRLPKRLGVGQEILLDPLAIGFEHDRGAAQLADGLRGPLDHAVALALMGVDHFSGAGHLESLLGARFGLQFGHLALLTRLPKAERACPPQNGAQNLSWLGLSIHAATAALSAGRREGRVMPKGAGKNNCSWSRRAKWLGLP